MMSDPGSSLVFESLGEIGSQVLGGSGIFSHKDLGEPASPQAVIVKLDRLFRALVTVTV